MLFGYEIKKLLLLPAVLGFIALCLAINILIIIGYDPGIYPDTGIVEPIDVFADYDAAGLGEYYIGKYKVTGNYAENIRAKYEKLQPVIDEKSANGDSLSPYFREQTYQMHGLLFGIVLKAVIAEACVAALFMALLSVNYENFQNTEYTVCSSKTGRKLIFTKLATALAAALVVFILLAGITLAAHFMKFDYSSVWHDNVSSAFNFKPNEYGNPFITWRSYTVLQYLWASIGAAAGLAVTFSLMGFAVGVFAHHGYGSAVAAVTLCFVMFIAEPFLPVGSHIRNAFNLTPVHLWIRNDRWFTEGNCDIIVANFETTGIVGSLAVLTVLFAAAYMTYKRRDL